MVDDGVLVSRILDFGGSGVGVLSWRRENVGKQWGMDGEGGNDGGVRNGVRKDGNDGLVSGGI